MSLAPQVKAQFLQFTQRFEGLTTWLYLDVKGLVTIGYGNLIDPQIPSCLDFRDKSGLPVPAATVRAEWQAVKAMTEKAPLGGVVFRDYTGLRASLVSINALAYAVLDDMALTLAGYFPEFGAWPADAQLATLSIAWACGSHFPASWPAFSAAARAQDWATCAAQCHIEDSHNPGVRPRNAANRALLSGLAVA